MALRDRQSFSSRKSQNGSGEGGSNPHLDRHVRSMMKNLANEELISRQATETRDNKNHKRE
jgi:hypothetical protein